MDSKIKMIRSSKDDPEEDQTHGYIEPGSEKEDMLEDFRVQKTKGHKSGEMLEQDSYVQVEGHLVLNNRIRSNGIEEFLTDEDYADIQAPLDATDDTIEPGSEKEENLKEFLY